MRTKEKTVTGKSSEACLTRICRFIIFTLKYACLLISVFRACLVLAQDQISTVTAVKEIRIPIMSNGKAVGEYSIAQGTPLKILRTGTDKLQVEFKGKKVIVPKDYTDYELKMKEYAASVEEARKRDEAIKQEQEAKREALFTPSRLSLRQFSKSSDQTGSFFFFAKSMDGDPLLSYRSRRPLLRENGATIPLYVCLLALEKPPQDIDWKIAYDLFAKDTAIQGVIAKEATRGKQLEALLSDGKDHV